MTNQVIEKYQNKTIRVNGKVYQIRITGGPGYREVHLQRQDSEVSSRVIPHDSAGITHCLAYQKAVEICDEVEQAEEVDIEA